MFGSKGFMRDGAQVDGVVIESNVSKVIGNGGGNGSYHVRVRVTFEDGTTGEFDSKLHTRLSGNREIGAVVPVRYDRADRSKIDVDEDEIRHRVDISAKQKADALAAPQPTLTGSPEMQLQALWEQQKKMDLRGSELRRSGAPREQVGAWVAEKEALDSRYRALRNQHPQWSPTPSAAASE